VGVARDTEGGGTIERRNERDGGKQGAFRNWLELQKKSGPLWYPWISRGPERRGSRSDLSALARPLERGLLRSCLAFRPGSR